MGRKVLTVMLGLCLSIGLLAGCGNSDSGNKAVTDNKAEQTAEAEKETETAEVVEEKEVVSEEPVALRIVQFGEAGPRNTEFFEGEFHDKVLEELNIDMTVELVPWGSADQIYTMAASGEGFLAMAHANDSLGKQLLAADLVAVLDEEMFQELAPNYMASRMGRAFDCQKYNGQVVAIPCSTKPTSGTNDNFAIRNDILNTVGWDVSQIHSYEDLMEAIAAVHAEYPDMKIMINIDNFMKMLMDQVAPDGAFFLDGYSTICTVNEADPESDNVINLIESEYLKNYCAITKEWFELGYLTTEDLTDPSLGAAAWSAGNCLISYGNANVLYNHKLAGVEGADVQFLKIKSTPNVLLSDSNGGWMVTIADQDKVEHWVRFIDWMYASKENYRFCLYGIEGVDYQVNANGAIEKLTSESFFYDWHLETLYYMDFPESEYDPGEVEAYLNFDDGCVYSKKIGFSFDNSAVEAEEAMLKAIMDEKLKPIIYGVGDYDTDFPAVLEELKAAGLDEYVAEYQRQFSEFMANK